MDALSFRYSPQRKRDLRARVWLLLSTEFFAPWQRDVTLKVLYICDYVLLSFGPYNYR